MLVSELQLSSPCMFVSQRSRYVLQTNLPCRRWFGYDDEESSMNGCSYDDLIRWTATPSVVEITCKSGEKKQGLCCLAAMDIPNEQACFVLQFKIFHSLQQASAVSEDFSPKSFMVEHSQDALLFCGTDGSIQDCNEKAKQVLKRDDLLGTKIFNCFEMIVDDPSISPSSSIEEKKTLQMQHAFETKWKIGGLFCLECKLRKPSAEDDKLIKEQQDVLSLAVRTTYSGYVVRLCLRWSEDQSGGHRDEKENEELEREKHLQQIQNEMAFNSCNDAITIGDFKSALIVRSNPAAVKMFGYTESEFRCLTGRMLADSNDPNAFKIQEDIRRQGWYSGRLMLKRKTGDSFHSHIYVAIVKYGDTSFVISIVQDITDMVAREQEMENRYLKLQNSMSDLAREDRMNLIGLLSAGVAHEINNPATILQGNIHYLQEKLDNNSQNQPALVLLNECDSAINRIISVVRVLACFSKTDQCIEPIDINEVIQSVQTLTFSEFRGDITLMLDLAPNIHTLNGDRGKLSQVLINLVLNSMKAVQHHNDAMMGCKYIKIATKELVASKMLEIVVSDNGCGIPEELQKKLFRPFTRVTVHGEGYGMGLTICRGIVEQHKGEIMLESSNHTGTVFKILLPIDNGLLPTSPSVKNKHVEFGGSSGGSSPRSLTNSNASTPRGPTSPSFNFAESKEEPNVKSKPKLLVVDDEKLILNLHRRNLSPFFDVHTANGGDEALEMLLQSNFNFDVVICDLMMPVDAKVVYDTLQEKKPGYLSKFVFCTAGAVTTRLQEFSKVAQLMHPFVFKPATKDKLMTACNAILETRENPL